MALLKPQSTILLYPSWNRLTFANMDPAELRAIYSNLYQNKDGPNNRSLMFWERKAPPGSIRGTFQITAADIETLRQLLKAKLVEQKQQDIRLVVSTFTLACAYTRVCIDKAEEINTDQTRLAFNVDCRSRLDPPVTQKPFWELHSGTYISCRNKSLVWRGGLDGAENWVSRVFAVSSEKMLVLAGSHRFVVYESDFGRGRPKKVEIVSIDRARAISFSDPQTDAGVVDVGLVLDKHNMQVSASLFAKGLENP
ncbi:unnamed protein product [Prunus armeniaca]|uniref:Uncharacterized protein n=1 Tax=Prunus armeniaca TaxID=36596 RepID=A0A6J5WYY8_PRUAR|nr:unnamed protein product [Prunus armeniaca]CAB4305217.1 unnamed protein product [Prunus armeniaca]